MRAIDQLRDFHREHIAPIIGPPVGAQESAVQAIERELGARMPDDYREFLLWFGGDDNGVLRGSDCFVHQVVENTRVLPEDLAENGLLDVLPLQYVCPFMHQGYIATWFALPTDAADPPGLLFNEGYSHRGVQSGETIMRLFLRDIIGMSAYLKHRL